MRFSRPALGLAIVAVAVPIALACSDDAAAPNGGGAASPTSTADGAGGGTPGSSGANPGGGGDGGGGDGGEGTPTIGGLFEQPEPWTKDVSAVTKDVHSDDIIKALKDQGGWGNGNKFQIDFSIPVLFATSATPKQTITKPAGEYCYGGPDCDPVPLQMPLPTGGNTEGSGDYTCDTSYETDGQGDCHVIVVEKDTKKLFELYNATKTGSGFTALGAFVWDLTKAYPPNLRGDQCTSADAAGFPIAALLPTVDEVAAGEVKHALRFILPNLRMRNKVYVHPASHAGDPKSPNPNAPPYGVRFRLQKDFDVTPYNAAQKVILAALKKYGMLLSDGGELPLTFADDRTSTAKWATLGVQASSFNSIAVDKFEVVDLSADIVSTQDCVRNP